MYEEKEIKYKKRKKEKNVKKKRFFTNENKYSVNIKMPNIKLPNINYKNLIKELLILMIVILLIIFTISRINKQQEEKLKDFNNNIDVITNSLMEYYNVNNLPDGIGESDSLLLDELRNLGLIEEVKENNVDCNYLNSYSIVTKNSNNEYRLKIYLSCPNTKKTVEKKIVCNDSDCKVEE